MEINTWYWTVVTDTRGHAGVFYFHSLDTGRCMIHAWDDSGKPQRWLNHLPARRVDPMATHREQYIQPRPGPLT